MVRICHLSHPLIEHHLVTLRDKDTSCAEFRATASRLAMLLGVYATEDLPTKSQTIQTPVAPCEANALAAKVGLVPILRAGLGLVEPLQQLIPDAEVWHLGLYRNEETAEPVQYYDKLPKAGAVDVGLVLDPMLATGGSVRLAIERLMNWGVPDIRVLSVIAARPGLERVQNDFPNVSIFVCAIDEILNDQQFIVPGLGDAGDRIFNTPSQ